MSWCICVCVLGGGGGQSQQGAFECSPSSHIIQKVFLSLLLLPPPCFCTFFCLVCCRQSAFDRLLASIPFKGQVLNQTAAWWFNNTQHIIPNAVLAVPDPNVTIMKKLSLIHISQGIVR